MDYRIKTEGMGCKHCIARVTKALESLSADIKNMELNDFTIGFGGDINAVRAAIEALGFKVKSIEEA